MAQRLLNTTSLDGGEAESIALASSRKVTLLADDKEARTVAGAMGIEHIGTAGVLLEAFVKEIVSYEELEKVLIRLGISREVPGGVAAFKALDTQEGIPGLTTVGIMSFGPHPQPPQWRSRRGESAYITPRPC